MSTPQYDLLRASIDAVIKALEAAKVPPPVEVKAQQARLW